MAVMDLPIEGSRQVERAVRLLDAGSSAPRGMRTPVHKSLEQLFGDARSRTGPQAINVAPFGPAGAARLLQAPQAQRLDREVTNFAIVGTATGATTNASGLVRETALEDLPNLGVSEFFGLVHERVLLCAVEEAHRDSMRNFERRSFERIQSEWEDAKAQIMNKLAPQRLGPSAVGSALRATEHDVVASTAAAPHQDAAIIDALLREPLSPSLVQRIARLSCDGCHTYHADLLDCWSIVGRSLHRSPHSVVRGLLEYLQESFAEQARQTVYQSADARLGGVPDAWSLIRALGRVKFETAVFPSSPTHVWFAAYVAARSGFAQLLLELPERAAPCSDRCPVLKTVCTKMARRLQATAVVGQSSDFMSIGSADQADLLRADLAEENCGFQNVLVSLLLGRSFIFSRLPEATVQDWLWFRLHALFILAGDSEVPPFVQQLDSLRQQALALPPSHFDPTAVAGIPASLSSSSDPSAGGAVPMGASGSPSTLAGVTQPLNFVKMLLLTAQFGRAIQQLRSQDECLHSPALHIALVLHRAGTLETVEEPDHALNVVALVCDHARRFSCSDQLSYFRILDLRDRAEALQNLLLRGGVGTNDELLGYIDANGRHRPGLLERALHEDGLGHSSEFVNICSHAGRTAVERGQYREAIRLFHLGRCHSEVLQVLCRCLRLPVWREPIAAAAGETALLSQDIQRFFVIYERNLDRYALSSHAWAVARKLYAARIFHTFCDQGRPEAALDIFDREQLLPFATEDARTAEIEGELLADCPRVVGDYVQVLLFSAKQGAVSLPALKERLQRLQLFLAVNAHRITLDQQTIAALAGLTLC
mmetsp:Transcript_112650/g.224022  ORF Transcript_112650/g.224022 Transcript_112650/m.224022 type:complete len:824 (+) Transcript_112650:147-2618(+)